MRVALIGSDAVVLRWLHTVLRDKAQVVFEFHDEAELLAWHEASPVDMALLALPASSAAQVARNLQAAQDVTVVLVTDDLLALSMSHLLIYDATLPALCTQDTVDDVLGIALRNREMRATLAQLHRLARVLDFDVHELRIAAEAAPDAIVASNLEGTIVFANTAARVMFGADLTGQPLDVITPQRHRQAHADGMRRMQAGTPLDLTKRPLLTEARHTSGTEFNVSITMERTNDRLIAIIRKVT